LSLIRKPRKWKWVQIYLEEIDELNLRIVANTEATEMEVGSIQVQEIQKGQIEDEKIQEIKRNIKEEKSHVFLEDE
jgi:hypothetical protein